MKLFIKVNYIHTEFEEHFEFDEFPVSIGRDPVSRCVLLDESVSRKHAEIRNLDDRLELFDLGSRNGLVVNGKRVDHVPLVEGSEIFLGSVKLSFSFQNFVLETTKDYPPAESTFLNPPANSLFARFTENPLATLAFLMLSLSFLSFLSTSNHFRREDLFKNVISELLSKTLLAPFVIFLLIIVFRKINQGQYSWLRSALCAYAIALVVIVEDLIQMSFCWFSGFHLLWTTAVSSYLIYVLVLFIWIYAVGKTQDMKSRMKKAFAFSLLYVLLFASLRMLSTGYKSHFELESCNSVSNWYWSSDKKIEDWQKSIAESALELK